MPQTALHKAKAELGRALTAQNPRRIARAAAKVMAVDPVSGEVLRCGMALSPSVAYLWKLYRKSSIQKSVMRVKVGNAVRRAERKTGISLAGKYRRILVESAMGALYLRSQQ